MKVISHLMVLIFFGCLAGCGGGDGERSEDTLVGERVWDVTIPAPRKAMEIGMDTSRSAPIVTETYTPAPRGHYTADDVYDEGYAEGYDQGEEDSRLRRHHGFGYDDDSDYSGYLEERYMEGYEDGYEDGYSNTFDVEEGWEEEDEYEY